MRYLLSPGQSSWPWHHVVILHAVIESSVKFDPLNSRFCSHFHAVVLAFVAAVVAVVFDVVDVTLCSISSGEIVAVVVTLLLAHHLVTTASQECLNIRNNTTKWARTSNFTRLLKRIISNMHHQLSHALLQTIWSMSIIFVGRTWGKFLCNFSTRPVSVTDSVVQSYSPNTGRRCRCCWLISSRMRRKNTRARERTSTALIVADAEVCCWPLRSSCKIGLT